MFAAESVAPLSDCCLEGRTLIYVRSSMKEGLGDASIKGCEVNRYMV